MKTKIAFIGLGNMGAGMCLNLVKAGYDVTAFDLNPEAVQRAEKGGAKGATSLQVAVASAETIITMLPAGKHVLGVYFGEDGVAEIVQPGTLFIDCSTISVEASREAAGKAVAGGFEMVDAPVSGGTAAANGGTLTFMVGGPSESFERAAPFLDVMGQNVVHAGAAGNGQVAKIANNMLLGISMIGTCEAFNLAERLGLDAQTFFDISSTASGQCWSMTSYCPAPGPVPAAPSNNDYKPGFAVDMMLKDLRLARDAASASSSETRLGELALQMYEALSNDGHGGLDFSGIMKRVQAKI